MRLNITRWGGRTLGRLGMLVMLLFGASCQLIAPPTPTPTLIPFPTRTPILVRTVIVALAPATQPPTVTPTVTSTPRPTQTRLPSITPRPTRTIIPSRTPIGGEPGVISADGLLTVALDEKTLTDAMREQRITVYFSATINSVGPVTLDYREIRCNINFNDFTTEGQSADIAFTMVVSFQGLAVGVGSVNVAKGSLSFAQIGQARQLLRFTVEDILLPELVKKAAPNSLGYTIVSATSEPDRLLITVQLELPPTPVPSETATPS